MCDHVNDNENTDSDVKGQLDGRLKGRDNDEVRRKYEEKKGDPTDNLQRVQRKLQAVYATVFSVLICTEVVLERDDVTELVRLRLYCCWCACTDSA